MTRLQSDVTVWEFCNALVVAGQCLIQTSERLAGRTLVADLPLLDVAERLDGASGCPSCYDVTVCPQRQRAGMRQPMTSKKRIRYWGAFDKVTGQFVRLTRIITHPARTVMKIIDRRKPQG